VLQRDDTCNTCLKIWWDCPEINAYHSLEYTDGNDFSFDYRLLPLFRKTIEDQIQYAYERTEPEDLERLFLSGAFRMQEQHCYNKIYRKLFNLVREVYSYEKEIKHMLEEQKQTILEKIAQKVDDIAGVSKKIGDIAQITQRTEMRIDFDFAKTEENMKKMAGMMRGVQQEARNSAESLMANETINNMKKYSELIAGSWAEYQECQKKSPFEEANDKSLRGLEQELAERKIPKKHPGFEKILLRFDITLDEISKEINLYFCGYRWDRLRERVEERLNTFNSDL